MYAPDAEAYTTFKELFDPLIEDYHNGFGPSARQPPTDLGKKIVDGCIFVVMGAFLFQARRTLATCRTWTRRENTSTLLEFAADALSLDTHSTRA